MWANFILLLTALLLAVVSFPVGLLVTLYVAIRTLNAGKAVGYLAKAALSIATAVDILGNTICRDLLNATLIHLVPEATQFGNYRETISSVLGKNKAANTLTHAGRGLAGLLNRIQPNHVENAIDNC